jgi:hydrogenase nickel incorporation protein HypB
MCLTCGCGDGDGVRVRATGEPEHHHGAGHAHPHEHGPTETLELGTRVLLKNDRLAEATRARLRARGVDVVNVMSSPGSGKTSLLERTISETGGRREICVVEGDQETTADAERIARAGARAVQVNTGAGCHLDAAMVDRAVATLAPPDGSLLFVENVGNLVCPALFDLGECAKVVVISVTEGDDKPLKYPHMFAVADLVVVNKTDLLPYVDFDVEVLEKSARGVNPHVQVMPLSVRDGSNLDHWYAWLGDLTATTAGRDPA